MDESELKAIIEGEMASSLNTDNSYNSSTLAKEQALALDYYQGDMPDMPAFEGQSKAVSTDVRDTVETMMPSLMEIFASGDTVVEFTPVGEEDQAAAEQETDVVNHYFLERNDGFLTLYSMIKDALLTKVGIAKFYWEDSEDQEEETYLGITDDDFALLALAAETGEIEIVEHTPQLGEIGFALHDVKVKKTTKRGMPRVIAIPPEEFGIARRARTIKDSPYCFHRSRLTVSDLVADGYEKDVVLRGAGFTVDYGEVEDARDTVEESDFGRFPQTSDDMREVDVTEHYIRVDYDGDGTAELRRVVTLGKTNEIIDNEPYDRMPFAAITPLPVTHRFYGLSIADLVIEIQRIKTALMRTALNQAYFANNQRSYIAESLANEFTIDDYLNLRPGAIVRGDEPGAVTPIPNPQLGFDPITMLEYADTIRETRSGVGKHMQGLDPDTLHDTATGFTKLMSMAHQRITLIARIFAETGIKDMFLGIHELMRKHGSQAETVRLRNQWVQVDPREWKTRRDMTCTVGIGSGTKESQIVFLREVLGLQLKAMEMQGGPGPIVGIENVYHTLEKFLHAGGQRNASLFFNDPATMPPQPPQPPQPDPEVLKAQAEMQLQQQQAEADFALSARKAEADLEVKRQEMQAELEMDRQRMAIQLKNDRDKMAYEYQLKREQLEAEIRLKREQQEANAFLAGIGAQGKVREAELGGEPG